MATSEVLVSFGTSVVTLFGGGAVILVAICTYFSKLIADRTIEGHKSALNTQLERFRNELSKESDLHRLKIRKAELIFERELKAVADFMVLHRQIRPSYSHPDMDWHEACDDVATRFSTIENQLEAYLINHAPVLTEALRKSLRNCRDTASHNKFSEFEMPDGHVSAAANTAAGEILQELEKVETGLFTMVKNETLD